jgi:hypothetical protein
LSPKIREYTNNEFILIERLIEKHRPLIQIAHDRVPDDFHISTLGAMLQSFYGGVENLFKRIALDVDGDFSKSDSWHKNLLDRMASPYKGRPAVISDDVRKLLHKYLDFRHVFRSVYSYDLNWNKMRDLVLGCEEALRLLQGELNQFVQFLENKQSSL